MRANYLTIIKLTLSLLNSLIEKFLILSANAFTVFILQLLTLVLSFSLYTRISFHCSDYEFWFSVVSRKAKNISM